MLCDAMLGYAMLCSGRQLSSFPLEGGLGTLRTQEVFGDISAFSQFLALIRNLRCILPLVCSLEGAWETCSMAGRGVVSGSQKKPVFSLSTLVFQGSQGHTVVGCFSFLSLCTLPSSFPQVEWSG